MAQYKKAMAGTVPTSVAHILSLLTEYKKYIFIMKYFASLLLTLVLGTVVVTTGLEVEVDDELDGRGWGTLSSKPCPKEGFYRDPKDCTKFYRCVDNGPGYGIMRYDFDCPAAGTVFNPDPKVVQCVWPYQLNPKDKCYKPQ